MGILRKIRRAVEYPSRLVPYLYQAPGGLLGRYQFESTCQVSPFCEIRTPELVSLGDGTVLRPHTVVNPMAPDGISFGSDCTLNSFSFLAGQVTIGDGVRIANQVSIHSFDHQMAGGEMIHEQGLDMGTVTIGDDVWIGTGSRILKDVQIGEGAVVGAGAVVTSDVPSYRVVGGVPAAVIGDRPGPVPHRNGEATGSAAEETVGDASGDFDESTDGGRDE